MSEGLRAYMAYDRHAGPLEGALCVFATSSKEAHRLAYPHIRDWAGCEYVDVAVRWLRSGCGHLKRLDEPHVIDNPPVCRSCEHWRDTPLDANGLCEGCAPDFDDDGAPADGSVLREPQTKG